MTIIMYGFHGKSTTCTELILNPAGQRTLCPMSSLGAVHLHPVSSARTHSTESKPRNLQRCNPECALSSLCHKKTAPSSAVTRDGENALPAAPASPVKSLTQGMFVSPNYSIVQTHIPSSARKDHRTQHTTSRQDNTHSNAHGRTSLVSTQTECCVCQNADDPIGVVRIVAVIG